MNSFSIIIGSMILSVPALATLPQAAAPTTQGSMTALVLEDSFMPFGPVALEAVYSDGESKDLGTVVPVEDLSQIVYLEEEPLIDLGFDPKDYLPEDFDPHEAYFDLGSVVLLGQDSEPELGFDPKDYLPEGFDPYTDAVGIPGINFMEDDRVNLGFDSGDYLPEGFDPYGSYLDLDSILYMELETEPDLGVAGRNLLPADFDPYTNVVPVGSINFMEDEDMELGFDTAGYLPYGFDPFHGSIR